MARGGRCDGCSWLPGMSAVLTTHRFSNAPGCGRCGTEPMSDPSAIVTPMSNTAKFQVGHTYQSRSFIDHEWVTNYTVVARTAKFVTLNDGSRIRRVGIKTNEWGEWVLPDGSYSLAPVLRAEKDLT